MSTLVGLWNRIQRSDSAPVADAADDVKEELMFHLCSQVEENRARGMSENDAWADAQQRFGSVDRYAKETWRIDMGTKLLIQRVAIGGMVVLFFLCGWLWVEVERLHAQNQSLTGQYENIKQRNEQVLQLVQNIVPAKAENAEPRMSDFTGTVMDDSGKPLADADLLVILKTWPGGRYMQEDFYAKSNSEGHFTFPKLVPVASKYAVQVAAAKKGYAFKSAYQLKQGTAAKDPEAVKFKLEKALPLTLVIHDKSDQPIKGAVVVPNSRKPKIGQEQSVYYQASEPLRCESNEKGEVSVPYFAAGDKVTIYLAMPGQEPQPHSFVVEEKDNPYTISAGDKTN
jgi:hypothetical protein